MLWRLNLNQGMRGRWSREKKNIFFYIHSNTFKMQVLSSLDALSSLTIYFIFTNDFW